MAAADRSRHTFEAMNTTIATAGLGASGRELAEAWFADAERNLSRFRPDSELSALNRSAGAAFRPSPPLRQVLLKAHRYHLETDGVFNPFLGAVLSGYGYAESFERLADRPAAPYRPRRAETGVGTAPPVSMTLADLEAPDGGVSLSPGVAIDLGGIAKGWSAARLAARLQAEGVPTGAVDAGGDMALWGAPPNGWEIGIAHPYDAEADLVALRLPFAAGIATSSAAKRRWRDAGGRELHHLLDPSTLTPARSDLLQATVFAPDATAAEVYAKCLLILGSRKGIPWLKRKRPDCAYIAVGRDLSVLADPAVSACVIEGRVSYATLE
ncbi:FAD:protein FMN transferase [Cohnella nanjingensis]|uniref:FAD:protein FMN transferase n=1 Tax=Cohnella nanjingensis TaxID=1387779 RepID=A0A7X0VH75_9BACL|nr:FAD:protein FMN transferase [Cohnella nanjingensis]MBB6673852.1 FAD:protein FMN transferase [Cohnella nanjingensis]